jgi:hypothetical protein
MKLDWIHIPMYNTLMSVAAGVGLLLLVMFGRAIFSARDSRQRAIPWHSGFWA